MAHDDIIRELEGFTTAQLRGLCETARERGIAGDPVGSVTADLVLRILRERDEAAKREAREAMPKPRYLSAAETAKLIRQALKDGFPRVKFSVRSRTYAGGASVDVKWTDGPTERHVERVAKRYQGGAFDGMTDMMSYHTTMLTTDDDAELVRFGADHVECYRDYSDGFGAELLGEIEAVIGEPLQFSKRYEAVVLPDDDGQMRTYRSEGGAEWGSDLLHRLRSARAR